MMLGILGGVGESRKRPKHRHLLLITTITTDLIIPDIYIAPLLNVQAKYSEVNYV